MKGNNSIFLRRSFFPRYALGMPSFNNSVPLSLFDDGSMGWAPIMCSCSSVIPRSPIASLPRFVRSLFRALSWGPPVVLSRNSPGSPCTRSWCALFSCSATHRFYPFLSLFLSFVPSLLFFLPFGHSAPLWTCYCCRHRVLIITFVVNSKNLVRTIAFQEKIKTYLVNCFATFCNYLLLS